MLIYGNFRDFSDHECSLYQIKFQKILTTFQAEILTV